MRNAHFGTDGFGTKKSKLNSRKFYRYKNFLSISVMRYFYCIAEIK
mgnify:CR=1 FL=1